MIKSIKTVWREFECQAGAKRPYDPAEIQEMKRAFYAGAWYLLNAIEVIGDGSISRERREEYLEAMKVECLDFQNDVRNGRA